VASWRTIIPGSVRMLDPVGTKEKHGFEHATTEAYAMFQSHLKMHMVTVHVNGDEMAWVIENHFTMNGETLKTHSIETFAWDEAGDLLIKTYYDMPADVGDGDDQQWRERPRRHQGRHHHGQFHQRSECHRHAATTAQRY